MSFKGGNDRDSDLEYSNIISDLDHNEKYDAEEVNSRDAIEEREDDNSRPEFNEVKIDDPQHRLKKKRKKRRKSFIYQNILNRESQPSPRD